MKLHEAKQKRSTIAGEMRKLHDDIGDNAWTEDQSRQWDAANDELSKLDSFIKREEEIQALDDSFIQEIEPQQRGLPPAPENEEVVRRTAAFDRFIRVGLSEMTNEERQLLKEARAADWQSVGANEKGGYTVPRQFLNRIVEAMKAYGGIASVSQILTTANGQPIDWVYSDGTDEEGALIGENEAAEEEAANFDIVSLGAKKLTSKIIRTSNELLQDSAVDIEGFLSGRIAQRLGRGEAKYLITGDGSDSKTPKGLERWVTKTKAVADGKSLTWEDILALKHSVDPAYRNSPKFRFAFNDNTLLEISKMKDNQNRPIWLPDIVGVAPATVFATQYVIDQGIADFGTGRTFMYCGDFYHFIIRRVDYMILKRLVERYAEYDQTAFLAFHRFDCVLEDGAAIKGLTSPNADIAVTGVTLDKATLNVAVGAASDPLVATVAPATATNKAVTWSSDNEKIATVKDGVVTGVKAGTANITATTTDGGKTATCAATVA